jgi:uncharacterized OsmC-like protein
MTSEVIYLGDLRTISTHDQSKNQIVTDAPIDNHGKGEAFSPTDMVANSLATCMMTVMGIKANDLKINLEQSKAHVTKIMGTEPRRITKIIVNFEMIGQVNEKDKLILERTANTCPVLYSLHPDIEKEVNFVWI